MPLEMDRIFWVHGPESRRPESKRPSLQVQASRPRESNHQDHASRVQLLRYALKLVTFLGGSNTDKF